MIVVIEDDRGVSDLIDTVLSRDGHSVAVAANAGDMISEITLAMTHKLGLRHIADTIHPYPTQAEAIRQIGDAYNRTRLTPFAKALFSKWMALRR